MENFWQLINEWEIQMLVLLSFILQVFLFFTGSLRRCSTNAVLRATIWVVYLGADVVAVYALGFLSRQDDATMEKKSGLRRNHPLAFVWVPFLLIHLGGQDTITAFAIEDNNLWLRHMLNMVVQVSLALYVFWKSTVWHSVWLLVIGIFLFVSGIIKYVERTMALVYGKLNNIRGSSSNTRQNIPLMNVSNNGYDGYLCFALRCALGTRGIFEGRIVGVGGVQDFEILRGYRMDHTQLFKLLDVELCIMYSDLYTKSRFLRTWSGTVLRLISVVSTVAALVLFTVRGKAGYDGTLADIVITYTLLMGGFLLEVCAVLMTFIATPWTWAWLKARGHHRLAHLSKFLLSFTISFGFRETGPPTWSNSMGQYSFLSYAGCDLPAMSLSQRVMSRMRKMARCLGIGEPRKLFWLSKLLDTRKEAVDDKIKACLVQEIDRIKDGAQQQWRHLGPVVKEVVTFLDFIYSVCMLHLITEAFLNNNNNNMEVSSAAASSTSTSTDDADICRKLSNYMLYLVAAHPASASLLQVAAADSPDDRLENLRAGFVHDDQVSKDAILREVCNDAILGEMFARPWTTERCKGTLEELRHMWVRLLLYAAGKSRPPEHAAQLARGGELLTFVWLLMAHFELGDSILGNRIDLVPGEREDYDVYYAIDPRQITPEQEIEESNNNTEMSNR